MAEFAARNTSAQTVVADTDRIILERVRKVIMALCHGTDKDTDTLLGTQGIDVVLDPHDWGFVTEGDFTAVGR